ncbi:hypothetical protein [Nocardia vaccinii]|uniref:hypothetical protein n=1 Tax=Nocardia vaccinii TaxID=1822 RepID=UPI0012F47FE3
MSINPYRPLIGFSVFTILSVLTTTVIWMIGQPGGQGVGFAVGQDIDPVVRNRVDHDRGIPVPTQQREVVDTDHLGNQPCGRGFPAAPATQNDARPRRHHRNWARAECATALLFGQTRSVAVACTCQRAGGEDRVDGRRTPS